jgi:hypothetical protein
MIAATCWRGATCLLAAPVGETLVDIRLRGLLSTRLRVQTLIQSALWYPQLELASSDDDCGASHNGSAIGYMSLIG